MATLKLNVQEIHTTKQLVELFGSEKLPFDLEITRTLQGCEAGLKEAYSDLEKLRDKFLEKAPAFKPSQKAKVEPVKYVLIKGEFSKRTGQQAEVKKDENGIPIKFVEGMTLAKNEEPGTWIPEEKQADFKVQVDKWNKNKYEVKVHQIEREELNEAIATKFKFKGEGVDANLIKALTDKIIVDKFTEQ